MAKVKVTANFVDQYFPVIAKVAANDLAKKAQEVGERLIRGQTRSGKQLVDGGAAGRQPPLSDSWRSKRGWLSRYNQTHPAFSQNRSNLTFTGQLVDAVTSSSDKSGASVRVKFFVKDTMRQSYRGASGKPVGKPLTNQTLAEYLSDKGRFFVGLDTKSRAQINNELTRILRRRLKVLLK